MFVCLDLRLARFFASLSLSRYRSLSLARTHTRARAASQLLMQQQQQIINKGAHGFPHPFHPAIRYQLFLVFCF